MSLFKDRYSTHVGKEVINWFQQLSLTTNGDDNHFDYISNASGDWRTCPIGQMSMSIERKDGGEPIDETLFNLGEEFNVLVKAKDFVGAKTVLNKIYDRAKEMGV